MNADVAIFIKKITLFSNTFCSTRHPAVFINPYYFSHVQDTKQYFSLSFRSVLIDVPVMALTSANVLPFCSKVISLS